MKALRASIFTTALLFVAVMDGCKEDKIICLSCSTPLVRYMYVDGIDTIIDDYTLLGTYRAGVDSYQITHGYQLYMDTLWNDSINYNVCFNINTYHNNVYPEAPQYYNRYCKIK